MIYRFGKSEEDHAKWLEMRQKYTTATEAASYVGLSPYDSAAKIMESKKEAPKKLLNKYIRSGVIDESSVGAMLNYDLGWDVEYLDPSNRFQFVFTDEENKLSATPDMFRWDVPSLVEAKTTGMDKFNKNWRTGLPPIWYLSQTQIQMHCTGMRTTHLTCKVPVESNPIGHVVTVKYVPEYVDLVIHSRDEFHKGVRSRVCSKVKREAEVALINSIVERIQLDGLPDEW